MIDLDEPAPRRNCVADDSINSQQIKRDGHADNIDDRVNRPDFVEVDIFDGRSVNPSFRFSHRQKHLQRQLFLPRSQGCGLFNDTADVSIVPVSVLFGMIDECVQ